MKAVSVYVFWTRGDGVISRLIAYVLNCKWTHCGIGFKMVDGSEIYYEALAGQGVVGPRPLEDLVLWQLRKPASRQVLVLEFPDLAQAADTKRQLVEGDKYLVTYSELALLGHWFLARYGLPLKDTPNRVICSEYVSRKLPPDYDPRCAAYPNHDSITPAYLHEFLVGQNNNIRYVAGEL